MNQGIIPGESSEAHELGKRREELTELEELLAQREAELAGLKSGMLGFESRYLSAVGSRYDELAEIEKEIARMQGLEFDADDDESGPDSLADDPVGCGQNRLHSDKLKKLYREVARRFHPDLAQCEHERRHRHQLMIEVNRAYETGAEDRLAELLDSGANLDRLQTGKPMSAELILLLRRLAEAKQRLSEVEGDLAGITGSEIYKLRLRVETAESMGVDLFADLLAQVDRQVRKARNRLEHLKSVMMVD